MTMSVNKIPLGRIIRIAGANLIVDLIVGKDISHPQNISGAPKFFASINSFVYSKLLDGRIVIGRVSELYDGSTEGNFELDFDEEENLGRIVEKNKYLAKIKLIGTYDPSLEKFEASVNTFPTIGNEVYYLPEHVEKNLFQNKSKNLIEIGKSFRNNDIDIYADIDILFGKHLGVFGTTGSGKTCTIVSLIQSLMDKERVRFTKGIEISPKIIIFDPNNEYAKAFTNTGYKPLEIAEKCLRLPHTFLEISEYYQLLNASSGVQMPVLKKAIQELKGKENNYFKLTDLQKKINDEVEKDIAKRNWLDPLLKRLEAIISDEKLVKIIDDDDKSLNTIDQILKNDTNEIFIVHSDFEREELDIIIFLFSKILYKMMQDRATEKNVILLFEEAHRYLNEEEEENFKLGTYYVRRIAREGRKFRINLIISTQKPSQISKTILSQCNSYIIHKLTDFRDLEIAKNVAGVNVKELVQLLPVLEKQYALVTGEAFVIPEIVRINDANPLPLSNDPQVVESWDKNKY